MGIATLGVFIFCFLDVLTTTLILSHGGYEMNPVMVPVVAMPLIHIIIKWVVVAFIVGIAAVCNRIAPRAGILILAVIIIWYAFIVVHNTIILLGFYYA